MVASLPHLWMRRSSQIGLEGAVPSPVDVENVAQAFIPFSILGHMDLLCPSHDQPALHRTSGQRNAHALGPHDRGRDRQMVFVGFVDPANNLAEQANTNRAQAAEPCSALSHPREHTGSSASHFFPYSGGASRGAAPAKAPIVFRAFCRAHIRASLIY